jgi:alanine racemase
MSLAGARLTIDLAALAANWRALADRAPGAETGAAVKGDGYGLGLEEVATALRAAGARTFFVARPEEGVRLRRAVPDAVIYVLDGLHPGGAAAYGAADLRPALASWPEIEEWAAWRKAGGKGEAAIHVDTGMNRLGLSAAEATALAGDSRLLAGLAPTLLISHLACSDVPNHPLNAVQLARFREMRRLFPGLAASLANSGGIFLGADFHFDMVRPGIALYGSAATEGATNPMRTVVTAEAQVLAVRDAQAGETVGYGATETLKRPSRLAILAAGYADGYHRLAGSSDARPGASVILRGRDAPIVGRVSMDLMAVDVTDIDGVARGDWAELFGPTMPIDRVARHAGTIGYELLTGLGRRYERRYLR